MSRLAVRLLSVLKWFCFTIPPFYSLKITLRAFLSVWTPSSLRSPLGLKPELRQIPRVVLSPRDHHPRLFVFCVFHHRESTHPALRVWRRRHHLLNISASLHNRQLLGIITIIAPIDRNKGIICTIWGGSCALSCSFVSSLHLSFLNVNQMKSTSEDVKDDRRCGHEPHESRWSRRMNCERRSRRNGCLERNRVHYNAWLHELVWSLHLLNPLL